jgi:pre-mRNA cleavage complex 2 protein Pcf11
LRLRPPQALPQHKLPPFYLLDSIAKNFPVPYAALFTRHIPPLFSSAYASVDGTTKSKLEEMLRTWRNGGPKGEPVFGIAVQEELEGRTWGREYVRQMQQVRLFRLLSLGRDTRRMHASSWVAGPDRRPASALPDSLHRSRCDRQQAIFARAAAPAPEPPKAPRALLAQQAQQQQQYAHSPSPYPSAYPPAPPAPVAYYQQQQQQPGRSPLPHPYATPPTVSTTPLPPPPIATGGGLDTNLLSFLSGLLNKAGSNGGASPAPSNPTEGAATPEQQQIQEPEIDEYDEEPDAFERLVLELNVRLENLDLKACVPFPFDVLDTLSVLTLRWLACSNPQQAAPDLDHHLGPPPAAVPGLRPARAGFSPRGEAAGHPSRLALPLEPADARERGPWQQPGLVRRC